MKKERMLNGLDSLFADNSHEEEDQAADSGVTALRISLVEPDRDQPRKSFDEDKLGELADNIKKHGVLQPILVRPVDGVYKIVAGERRWRAARLAGLVEIPALVRELSDIEAAQIALIENIQREDLNPIEEAKAFKRLSGEFSMTQEKISEMVGKSRSYVANSVRLLNLCDEVQEAVAQRRFSMGHAKVLCSVEDIGKQVQLMRQAEEENMSVRRFEEQVLKTLKGEDKKEAEKKPSHKPGRSSAFPGSKGDVMLSEARSAMEVEFGISPQFKRLTGGRVLMQLEFGSDEDLAAFMKKLSEN